jgi:hypothetical protein
LCGQAQQIHRQRPELHRTAAHHLHRIHMQQRARPPALLAKVGDRLQGAHLALTPDQRHQVRGLLQGLRQGITVHQPFAIHRQPRHLPAHPRQLRCGRLRCGMLDA